VLFLLSATTVAGHDAVGVPRVVPDGPGQLVMRLEERVDAWEVSVVERPAQPRPDEPTRLHVRVRRAGGGRPYTGRLSLTLLRITAAGVREPVHGPEEVACSRGDSRFEFVHPSVDNFEVLLEFADWGGEHSLRYAYVVGRPGSPWVVLGSTLALFFALVVVVQFVKRSRRRIPSSKPAGGEDA